MPTRRKTPWEKPDPKPPAKRRHLTPAQKKQAASRAKRAGRPYPNLVDNMAVARSAGKKRASAGKRRAPARKKRAVKAKRTPASPR